MINGIIAKLITIVVVINAYLNPEYAKPTPQNLIFAVIVVYLNIASYNLPKFYKIDKLIKKCEKEKLMNIDYIKRDIERDFKKIKIDGMEREYLYQRIRVIEIRNSKKEDSKPMYAAGSKEDNIRVKAKHR